MYTMDHNGFTGRIKKTETVIVVNENSNGTRTVMTGDGRKDVAMFGDLTEVKDDAKDS